MQSCVQNLLNTEGTESSIQQPAGGMGWIWDKPPWSPENSPPEGYGSTQIVPGTSGIFQDRTGELLCVSSHTHSFPGVAGQQAAMIN